MKKNKTNKENIQENNLIDEKELIKEEIRVLVNELRGKTKMNPAQVNRAFDLFNRFFERNEQVQYCGICVARIYTQLLKVI
jgi:hypothetical protein